VTRDTEGALEALQDLAAEEVNAIGTTEVDSSSGQMDAIGAQLGLGSAQSWGTWYPQLIAEYVHEFDNDAENITGRHVDAPTFSFSMPIDDPDRDFAHLGVSSSLVFNSGVAAFASFHTLLGYEDLTTHAVELGVRIQF
ncbi:MAG: autotransporter domain-containing protein, partial [Gammaproteobacteria bacterium]